MANSAMNLSDTFLGGEGLDANLVNHIYNGLIARGLSETEAMEILQGMVEDSGLDPYAQEGLLSGVGYDYNPFLDTGMYDEVDRQLDDIAQHVVTGVYNPPERSADQFVADNIKRRLQQAMDSFSNTPAKDRKRTLNEKDEGLFRNWYDMFSQRQGLSPDPDDPEQHYDYRGWWEDATEYDRANARNTYGAHLSDRYKLPGHETFSDESIYYDPSKPETTGGHWNPDGTFTKGPANPGYAVPYVFDHEDFDNRQFYMESDFGRFSDSPKGARGPWQIMPSTEADYVKSTGKSGNIYSQEYAKGVRDWYMDWLYNHPNVTMGNPTEENRRLRQVVAYNGGIGYLGNYLRKLAAQGVDIDNSTDWIEGVKPESRDYGKFIVLHQDTPKRTNETYQDSLARYQAKTGTSMSEGGSIHIDPSKRGTFKAQATKMGMGVKEAAHHILAHKDNYSPAMVKKANFAANFADDGGNLYWPGGSLSPVNRKVFIHGIGNAARRLIPKRIVESVNEAASSHSNEKYAAKDFFDTMVTKEGREYLKDITDSDFKDVGRGFLLDDSRQRQFMESLGYHLADDMNYGMVNKATNNLMQKTGKPRVPIYQLGEDDIDPSLVTLVSTDPKVVSHYHVPYDRQLNHANSYPSALYADADGNHYVKSWDLNDYGQHNGNLADSFVNWVSGYSGSNKDSYGSTYGKNQFLAEMYDLVGNPFVQRTGLVKVDEPDVVDKKQEERLKAALDALSDLTTSKSGYRSGGTLLRPYNKFEMGGPEGDGVDKNTTIQKDNTSVHIPLNGLLENSTLNWDAKSWLGERAENDRGPKYTDEDVRIFESHVPEYRQIEQKAKIDGTWLKMPDGSTWRGDPRDWVVMQSEAFRNNYSPNPWWTGQKRYVKDPDTGSTGVSRARYYDGTLWFSDNPDYAKTFSDVLAENDKDPRRDTVTGHVFLAGVPNNVNVMDISGPANSTADMWYDMPYGRDSSGNIVRLPDEEIIRRQMPVPKIHFDSFPLDIAKRIRFKRNKYNEIDRNVTSRPMKQKIVTDSLVDWASKLGAPGVYLHSVDDGPLTPQRAVYDPEYGGTIGGQMYDGVVDELITLPGLTPRIKFIHGNNGDFDPSKEDKYSSVGVSPRGGLS